MALGVERPDRTGLPNTNSSCITFTNCLIKTKNLLSPNPLDLKQDLETYEVEDEQENEYEYKIENKN